MSFKYIDPRSIDDSPLLRLLTKDIWEGVGQVAGKIASVTGGLLAGIGNAVPNTSDFAALSFSLFGGDKGASQGQAVAQPRAVEVSAPAQSQDRFTVAMSEIGTFSPPSFDSSAQSTGRTV